MSEVTQDEYAGMFRECSDALGSKASPRTGHHLLRARLSLAS